MQSCVLLGCDGKSMVSTQRWMRSNGAAQDKIDGHATVITRLRAPNQFVAVTTQRDTQAIRLGRASSHRIMPNALCISAVLASPAARFSFATCYRAMLPKRTFTRVPNGCRAFTDLTGMHCGVCFYGEIPVIYTGSAGMGTKLAISSSSASRTTATHRPFSRVTRP